MLGLFIETKTIFILGIPLLSVLILIKYLISIKRNPNTSLLRHLLIFAFGVYFLALIGVTLFPININNNIVNNNYILRINYIPFLSIVLYLCNINTLPISLSFRIAFLTKNIIGNILLLLPLSFFIPMLYPKINGLKTYFFIGLIASLSIESLQLLENILGIGFRYVDIDDVIFNTFGVVIGYMLKNICIKHIKLT